MYRPINNKNPPLKTPKFAQISDYGVVLLVKFFRALIYLGVVLLFQKIAQYILVWSYYLNFF